jgi:LysR family transcriptional regulator for bpeEF and oprC
MDRWSALRTFVRVVETRSFARVARELGTTQPTVSRQVAGLEEALGVRLLTRTTRRVEPTEAGWAYYHEVSGPLDAIEAASLALKAGEEAEVGWVRVAAPGAMGRRLIAPLIAPLMEQAPGLMVELRLSDTPVDMVADRIDLALRVGLSGPEPFRIRKVGVTTQRLVGTPALVAAYREAPEEAVFVMRRTAGGALLSAGGEALGLGAARARLVVDDVETACMAVMQGVGLGLLPLWLIEPALASGALQIAAPDFAPGAPLSVVIGHSGPAPRRVQRVLDALVAGLEPLSGG